MKKINMKIIAKKLRESGYLCSGGFGHHPLRQPGLQSPSPQSLEDVLYNLDAKEMDFYAGLEFYLNQQFSVRGDKECIEFGVKFTF
ncbi:MAG: hypothetical protein ACM3WV_07780 [Bacillota bacterium]